MPAEPDNSPESPGDARGRIASALMALRGESRPAAVEDERGAPSIYGERLALLLGRRVEQVEGAVAVAMDLADRTGVELRDELQGLAEQLETVTAMVKGAPAQPRAHDVYELEARFDEVHGRIDAVTRELRAGVAALEQRRGVLPAPYSDRIAQTLGKRVETIEGAVEVTSALAERIGFEVRDELADVAAAAERRRAALADELTELAGRLERLEDGDASGSLSSLAAVWRAELRALDVRLGDELSALREEIRRSGRSDARADLALQELIARIRAVESDRDAITAQLVRAADSWTAERVALQERVAELAARIVTGPADVRDGDVWPSSRAFDQLRISVEGLRMRLAYHEKEVAEVAGGRKADQRLDEMHQLLGRVETAGRNVRDERDSVLEQLERIASKMDLRLQQLETPASDG